MSKQVAELASSIADKAAKLLTCMNVKGVAYTPELVQVDDSYSSVKTESVRFRLDQDTQLFISITSKKPGAL